MTSCAVGENDRGFLSGKEEHEMAYEEAFAYLEKGVRRQGTDL